MPEAAKKPVDSLQELVAEIGKDAEDKDGALHVLAKGMGGTLTQLVGLVAALVPLSTMEKAAQAEVVAANTEGAGKRDTDPGKNDDANKPEGTDVDDDTRAGYTDMSKARTAMPDVGTHDGAVDVTGFLQALWNRMEVLEKGQNNLVSLLSKIDRQSLARDALVGEALSSGFATLAMGMVSTNELLTKIPALPGAVTENALATAVRGNAGQRLGGAIGGRGPSSMGGPVALDDVAAQGKSGVTIGMMMKGLNKNLITEDHVRIWKKTGQLDPSNAENNAVLVDRVKNAGTEAAA